MNPTDEAVKRAVGAGREFRRSMTTRLKEAGIVTDPRVLDALREVPRHLFVPTALVGEAYGDHALPIGFGQTITQAANVGRCAQLLGLTPRSRVLEIGTGSGYEAAVLSLLAHRVYSLERIPELATQAIKTISALGIGNVTVKVFDGTYGWSAHAPYDGIVVAAAAPEVPTPLLAQLAPTGRLVVPVGDAARQRLLVVRKLPSGRTRTEDAGEVAYVPLVGKFGFGEDAKKRSRPGVA
jgi:protein-L-isoaspartate(D-aspartate) O-methyltransferase